MSPRHTTWSHRSLRQIAGLLLLGWIAGAQADELTDQATSVDRLIEEAASRQSAIESGRGWSLAETKRWWVELLAQQLLAAPGKP